MARTRQEAATALEVVGELSTLLSATRADAGLSLREVEGECGVPFATLHRIERGQSSPSGAHVLSLLRWLSGRLPVG